jgi:hypothetical protein
MEGEARNDFQLKYALRMGRGYASLYIQKAIVFP